MPMLRTWVQNVQSYDVCTMYVTDVPGMDNKNPSVTSV